MHFFKKLCSLKRKGIHVGSILVRCLPGAIQYGKRVVNDEDIFEKVASMARNGKTTEGVKNLKIELASAALLFTYFNSRNVTDEMHVAL